MRRVTPIKKVKFLLSEDPVRRKSWEGYSTRRFEEASSSKKIISTTLTLLVTQIAYNASVLSDINVISDFQTIAMFVILNASGSVFIV
jgi:hypothetical protein